MNLPEHYQHLNTNFKFAASLTELHNKINEQTEVLKSYRVALKKLEHSYNHKQNQLYTY